MAELSNRAFTLIELLVAVSVLALITLLMTQMFSAVNDTWLKGQARVDNFSKARVLLDFVAEDLKRGVYRSDLASFPNSSVAFYTRRPGFITGATSLRDVSLVQYTLQASAILQRSDLAIGWDKSDAAQISFGTTTSLPNATGLTPRDMAEGVLDFRILFLDKNGGLSTTYDPANLPKGFALGLAVVDSSTLKRLTTAQIAGLRAGLEAGVTGTNTLKADWENYLQTSVDWSTYPKGLGGGFKIFERYVFLP